MSTNRYRFLSSGLAAVAVASAITLAGPTAASALDERPCGQPAVPAVFDTIIYPARYQAVPEQSHQEWLWTRAVDTVENQYDKVVSPAVYETDWTRAVPNPDELQFTRTVILQARQPAVEAKDAETRTDQVLVSPAEPTNLWVWEHTETGHTQIKPVDWAADNSDGTEKWVIVPGSNVITEAVFEDVIVIVTPAVTGSPEVPEVTDTEFGWFVTDPGGDWTATGASRSVNPTIQNATTDGVAPAGDGWDRVGTRLVSDEERDSVWGTSAPAGYEATGVTRTVTTTVTTQETSATAPEGDGWTPVDGSETKVVTREAGRVEVSPERTEQVLVSAAIPATDACANDSDGQDDDQDGYGEVAGPMGPAQSWVLAPGATQDGSAAQAGPASATNTGVLPNTGNEATAGMAATGFAAVVLGAMMVGLGRRRRTA